MKKKESVYLIVALLILIFPAKMIAQSTSFHTFSARTIDGMVIDFKDFKGKKILVVNTASKCGLTPQYKELEELNQEYGGEHFMIIGFPANNFMNQEPGSDEDIKEFCEVNYGVTFQMMSKISVKDDDINPIYEWLTSKELNGVMDSEVTWNFQKYMVDEEGNLVDFASPRESPKSEKIIDWLKG